MRSKRIMVPQLVSHIHPFKMFRFLCGILYAFSLVALIVHALPTPYGSSLRPSLLTSMIYLARLWVTHFLSEYCFLAVELIEI